MAERLMFNGIEINVAEYQGMYFFNRSQVSKAVGYKSTLNVENPNPIKIGNTQFLDLTTLASAFSQATGERKVQCIGLLHQIYEAYGISPVETSRDRLADLDELARRWATARLEVKTARQMLEEASEKEASLFAQLREERNNG